MSLSAFERSITSLARQGIKYDLARMIDLAERTGHPERSFRTLHVAGSNGKGSTCAFLAAMLQAAGHRVGLYTSPHLVSFRERIRVDGLAAPDAELSAWHEELRPLLAEAGASFFEATTLLAFVHFARKDVDVAVIEVGLGGRLDATNVIEPEGVAITSLSLEHTKILGSTIAEIATEKAGVIKGAPVVSTVWQPEARAVLRARADDAGAELTLLERGRDWDVEGDTLVFPSHGEQARVGLEGPHQIENAALAWFLARAVHEAGRLAIPPSARCTGLENTSWPGRFDRRKRAGRTILFDVAHNADGARALAMALRATYAAEKLPVVLGVLADKDQGAMCDALGPIADPLWLTTPLEPERALRAEELGRIASSRGFRGRVMEPPGEAARAALAAHTGSTPVVITGSLFTVGPAMAALGFDPSAEPVGLRARRGATSCAP